MPRIKEQALKAELAKHGFESVSIKTELPGGRIQVEANKLYPVPNPAAVTDAARYIKTLRDSGQLTSTGEQQSAAVDSPGRA
jgi:hypothetical protein